MAHFQRLGVNKNMQAEDVDLDLIASKFGTPTYVYSRTAIEKNVKAFQTAFKDLDHRIFYSVKTNSNLAILQLMRDLGCGFETVSGGELLRVQKAGGSVHDTIFSGVGKTDIEIAQALEAGVRYICIESEEELWAVRDVASKLQTVAPVGMRVNPDVDAKTHPHISTGLKENKFGVLFEDAERLLLLAHSDPYLKVVGISCHIGSQITTLAPFVDASQRVASLARALLDQGVALEHVGMGGGLGICYHNEAPPDPKAYAQVLSEALGPLKLQILLEPGRVLVGNAGVLISRVVRTKANGSRKFVILDAGMNDLMRPAMYDAFHEIEAASSEALGRTPAVKQDIVGPVCESSDAFAKDRVLPPLHTGDLVVLHSAGAYGFAMTSNFNGRSRPAEVMVHGERFYAIRHREAIVDLWKGELDLECNEFDASLPKAQEQTVGGFEQFR